MQPSVSNNQFYSTVNATPSIRAVSGTGVAGHMLQEEILILKTASPSVRGFGSLPIPHD